MDGDSKARSDSTYELGVKAERERVVSILGSPEADGRLPVAMQCIQFGLAYGASVELLKAVPKQAAAAQQSMSEFAVAMAALGNPRIQASGDVDWRDAEAYEAKRNSQLWNDAHAPPQFGVPPSKRK